jgi:hypothetical protein
MPSNSKFEVDFDILACVCSCKQGLKQAGCCIHVATFIYYLSYAKFREKTTRLPAEYLNTVLVDMVKNDAPNNPNVRQKRKKRGLSFDISSKTSSDNSSNTSSDNSSNTSLLSEDETDDRSEDFILDEIDDGTGNEINEEHRHIKMKMKNILRLKTRIKLKNFL